MTSSGYGWHPAADGRSDCARPIGSDPGRPHAELDFRSRSDDAWRATADKLELFSAFLLEVALTPGQRHELIGAPDLLEHANGKALVGDTGYDSNAFVKAVRKRGMQAVIHPSRSGRKSTAPIAGRIGSAT